SNGRFLGEAPVGRYHEASNGRFTEVASNGRPQSVCWTLSGKSVQRTGGFSRNPPNVIAAPQPHPHQDSHGFNCQGMLAEGKWCCNKKIDPKHKSIFTRYDLVIDYREMP
ncbi:hypothetical protein PCASD_23897, partial [Puccinia coronata f. sp. avenae]